MENIESRLLEIISRIPKEPETFTGYDGTNYTEPQGEYLQEFTEAVVDDIRYYEGIFTVQDEDLAQKIATWADRLSAYGKTIEQMGEDFKTGKHVDWDDELEHELADEVVDIVTEYMPHEEEPYKGFLLCCLAVARRVYYIHAWGYMIYEAQEMDAVKNRTQPVATLIFCRKKLLELLIHIRDINDNWYFVMGELERSGDALHNMV